MGSVIDAVALVLFPVLMSFAVFSDILTMTIANWVSLALVAGFAILATASGMPASTVALDHLTCGALVLLVTFGFFARGWVGGGDAKLAAATAIWVGWAHLADYALLSSLLGAALTLGLLWSRKQALPSALQGQAWASRLHDARTGIPYGVALGVAGLVLYPDTAIWRAAVGG